MTRSKLLLIALSLIPGFCFSQDKKDKPLTKDGKPTNKTGISLIQDNRIMFLNAYNFDFGTTSLKSNYVGHVNLFCPSINRKKAEDNGMTDGRFGWGFNTGIMKINYQQKDSSNMFNNFKENVFISPFDVLKDSIKYLRQINTYKVETSNIVWSFYVQPTFELTKASGAQHIYIHGHAELLASHWQSKVSISNSKTDTAVYLANTAPRSFVIRNNINTEISTSSNIVAGYFGLGITFDLKPWDKGSFFFQPTFGFTTNRPSASSTEISTSVSQTGISPKAGTLLTNTWNSFYLIRSYYTHSIAATANDKGSTIILGMDIRGFFPTYAPQYAAYIGLNVGLDSILGLIKGESK